MTANDKTTDPNFPIFELPDLTDPETGLALSYKVTFDSALKSLMSYNEESREITTEGSTLDSGAKPGLYHILVETICGDAEVWVQLRGSGE